VLPSLNRILGSGRVADGCFLCLQREHGPYRATEGLRISGEIGEKHSSKTKPAVILLALCGVETPAFL
jgi:hypothetical protein